MQTPACFSITLSIMADPELVNALDYILNRSDESSIEALAQAVVRRRRDLTLFQGTAKLPDTKRMARDLSGQINAGVSIQGLREVIQDMAVRIIKQEAPELSDEQIIRLTAAWIPGKSPAKGAKTGQVKSGAVKAGASKKGTAKAAAAKAGATKNRALPSPLLLDMVHQFISFSRGSMDKADDHNLRKEMEDWPSRYWEAFPGVVQLLIKDYLEGELTEKEFYSRLAPALAMKGRA